MHNLQRAVHALHRYSSPMVVVGARARATARATVRVKDRGRGAGLGSQVGTGLQFAGEERVTFRDIVRAADRGRTRLVCATITLCARLELEGWG